MSMLNKKNCKQYLLEQSMKTRAGKFTRVSASVWPMLEASLRKTMEDFVRSHPTVGVTLSCVKTAKAPPAEK